LSARRADAVADVLVDAGLQRNGIQTIGAGKRNPVADNSTAAGRAQNRRGHRDLDALRSRAAGRDKTARVTPTPVGNAGHCRPQSGTMTAIAGHSGELPPHVAPMLNVSDPLVFLSRRLTECLVHYALFPDRVARLPDGRRCRRARAERARRHVGDGAASSGATSGGAFVQSGAGRGGRTVRQIVYPTLSGNESACVFRTRSARNRW
jgi:hypothetical protein